VKIQSNYNPMCKTIKLELTIDLKKVMEKYPNYKHNFRSGAEFVDFIVASLPLQNNDEFGYTLKLKT